MGYGICMLRRARPGGDAGTDRNAGGGRWSDSGEAIEPILNQSICEHRADDPRGGQHEEAESCKALWVLKIRKWLHTTGCEG